MFKKLAIGVSALVIALILPITAFASFYPADRPTYTCATPTQCEGADHVTFNSFTNNPVVGDERPFFSGSLGGANVQDRIKVKDGDVITLRAYVHNNADPNKIGAAAAMAKNVRMRVLVPNDKKADHNLTSFISASNANPGTVNDTMSLYGDSAMALEYVTGSAKFDYRPDGVNMQSVALSDGIISGNGASLGDLNGCFQYSGYVTLQVKVKMDTPPQPQPSVVCDALTAEYIGTTKVPAKIKFTAKATAKDGAVINGYSFNFGDGEKADGANATVEHTYNKAGQYKATVQVKSTLGTTEIVDRCAVVIKVTEDQPPVIVPPTTPETPVTPGAPSVLPSTGPEAALAGIFGTGALGYAARQFVASRRRLSALFEL